MAKGKSKPEVPPAPEISAEQRLRNIEAALRALGAASHVGHTVDALLSRDTEPESEPEEVE